MAGQNIDQFEVYFKRADLDGDGKISGAEAVSFFQGSGLPKQVLAQIWMHADQRSSGFLGRQDFYNALKLVTVAQSKRELTPDIVKAALYGPAAAKIPAPQINSPAALAPQMGAVRPALSSPQMGSIRPALSSPQMGAIRPALSSPQMGTVVPSVSAPQMGAVTPGVVQNPGFRAHGIPNPGMHQLQFPSQISQSMRPPQVMPAGTPRPPQAVVPDLSRGISSVSQVQSMPAATASRPSQPITSGFSSQNQNLSTDWLGGGFSLSTAPNALVQSTISVAPNSQAMVSVSSQATANESKAPTLSGNGFAPDSVFGGDAVSAAPSKPNQEPSKQPYSPSSLPASSPMAPISNGGQPIIKSNSLDSLHSFSAMQSTGNQLPRAHSSIDLGQPVSSQSSPMAVSSGGFTAVTNPVADHSQPPWPKMKPSDVQKYAKVFLEVDTDRDVKITGDQARNLFLSWRLPREVLKQVWDLSDQDNDSMLSLREFCFALYLMERYREGRPLPAMLPRSVMFDEALLSMTGQPNAAYGNPAWSPSPGFVQPQGAVARPTTHSTGFRPQVPPNASHTSANVITNQSKSRETVLDDSFANQDDNDDQNTVNSKFQNEMADEQKVDTIEKVILDSKEKIEFYRSKMQELILYKSRCDNRLNEITERAIADKREAEMLGKKYEEKYKQVAEIASKLTIEEAKFREIQERKSELGQAIINVERGGSADGILQVRSDRIQSDLEELMKVLTEVCKKHAQEIKSSAVIELPVGWQPGISEGAAIWDEDWDKFEDEGFGNELTFDTKGVAPPPKPDSATLQHEGTSLDGSFSPNSSVADDKHVNVFETGELPPDVESMYSHSEDESARSPQGSPAGRASQGSPSRQNFDSPFRSNELEAGTGRSFDDSTWGTFDNDDTDSIWGFNPAKDTATDKHGDYFASSGFDTSSTRADSPSGESVFNKNTPFTFEESVPSSPQSRFGSSPPRFSDVSRDQFDSFSRFDSFNTHDSGFSHQPDRLARFDSMSSTTKDYGHGFSFDDNDPFGSSGAFKVSSGNQTPKKSSDNWSPF